jgi:hypothetical protein
VTGGPEIGPITPAWRPPRGPRRPFKRRRLPKGRREAAEGLAMATASVCRSFREAGPRARCDILRAALHDRFVVRPRYRSLQNVNTEFTLDELARDTITALIR